MSRFIFIILKFKNMIFILFLNEGITGDLGSSGAKNTSLSWEMTLSGLVLSTELYNGEYLISAFLNYTHTSQFQHIFHGDGREIILWR
jgi:hypothetical protein